MDGLQADWPMARLRALAYTTGVLLKGDGSVYRTIEYQRRHGRLFTYVAHRISLKNKSIGFMRLFNRELAITLGRRPLAMQGPNQEGHFILQSRSKCFVIWWNNQSLGTLRPLLEQFPVEYLKGRFDSDGSVNKYVIYLLGAESHRDVLELDRLLCLKLGI